MSGRKLNAVHISIAVLSLSTVLGATLARTQPISKPRPSVPVEPIQIKQQAVRQSLVLTGQVEPFQVATLSSQVSARVRSRPKEVGQPVRPGETLVQMDDQLIRTQLEEARGAAAQGEASRAQASAELERAHIEVQSGREQARAQLLQAGAALHKSENLTRVQELESAKITVESARASELQAQRDAQRFEKLLEEGAVTRQQSEHQNTQFVEARARRVNAEQALSLAREGQRQEDRGSARAQLQSAQAGVRLADSGPLKLQALSHQVEGLQARAAQARLSVEEAQIQLERHNLRAPFKGRVLALFVQPGDLVNPGTPVARIGRVDRLKVTFGVPAAARTRLHLGQPVDLKIEGRALKGKIFSLGFEGEARTHNFPVEVVVENPAETVLPNMVARLQIQDSQSSQRVLLPITSLSSDGPTQFVYVIKNGSVHRRDVVVGAAFSENIEIQSGLASGELVAAHPQRLTDGLSVTVK